MSLTNLDDVYRNKKTKSRDAGAGASATGLSLPLSLKPIDIERHEGATQSEMERESCRGEIIIAAWCELRARRRCISRVRGEGRRETKNQFGDTTRTPPRARRNERLGQRLDKDGQRGGMEKGRSKEGEDKVDAAVADSVPVIDRLYIMDGFNVRPMKNWIIIDSLQCIIVFRYAS